MSEPETLRSVTTLGAVVLGFALGQTSEWFKARRKAKKQKKAVRRLIELETKENVSRIGHFWHATLAKKEEWKSEDGEFLYGQLADQLSRIPFPPIWVKSPRHILDRNSKPCGVCKGTSNGFRLFMRSSARHRVSAGCPVGFLMLSMDIRSSGPW